MKRVLVADERALRARKHLSKRYGAQLKAWARARASDWQIDRSWDVARVVAKLDRLCSDEVWTLLGPPGEISELDRWMCMMLDARVSLGPLPEHADELNVHEVHNLMRIWFPQISRARIRTLLFRTERKGLAVRERRGVYLADEWGSIRRWRRDFGEADEEGMLKWERRRRRAAVALAVHYLLPRFPVYRKASALGMSERNFHYAINAVIEEIGNHLSWWKKLQRRNVQS
jgi:hypothetical protein